MRYFLTLEEIRKKVLRCRGCGGMWQWEWEGGERVFGHACENPDPMMDWARRSPSPGHGEGEGGQEEAPAGDLGLAKAVQARHLADKVRRRVEIALAHADPDIRALAEGVLEQGKAIEALQRRLGDDGK